MLDITMLPKRFQDKIRIEGECWIWTGSQHARGYGQVRWKGKSRKAHRVIHEMLKGPIPEGLEPDHLCRRNPCVYPDHLEPVTHKVNCLRALTGPIVENAAKTACPKGHPYVQSKNPREGRRCSPCRAAGNRERTRRWREKRISRLWKEGHGSRTSPTHASDLEADPVPP